MGGFPVPLLNLFSPSPETTLLHTSRLVYPQIFMHVETISPAFIDNGAHFVDVVRDRSVAIDLSGQVCGSNLALLHGHVTHLGAAKVHAIANCVHAFRADYAHGPINVDVAFVVCNTEMGGCR